MTNNLRRTLLAFGLVLGVMGMNIPSVSGQGKIQPNGETPPDGDGGDDNGTCGVCHDVTIGNYGYHYFDNSCCAPSVEGCMRTNALHADTLINVCYYQHTACRPL